MATWIDVDVGNRVIAAQANRHEGWHRVKPTLNGRIMTDDGIPMYLWDGADGVTKRDDQSIARERRERQR